MTIPLIELAYIAGIVDGEGSISIIRRKHKLGHYYHLMVCVTNSHYGMLKWLAERFGENIHEVLPRRANRKKYWQWHINGDRALSMLREIQPYLIIKKCQADEAVRFQESKMGFRQASYHSLTSKEVRAGEQSYLTMKKLNNHRNLMANA